LTVAAAAAFTIISRRVGGFCADFAGFRAEWAVFAPSAHKKINMLDMWILPVDRLYSVDCKCPAALSAGIRAQY